MIVEISACQQTTTTEIITYSHALPSWAAVYQTWRESDTVLQVTRHDRSQMPVILLEASGFTQRAHNQ